MFILHIHECRHTHIQTNIHTVCRLRKNIYVYIKTYIYIHVYVYIYVCKHINIYIHTYQPTNANKETYMHIHTYLCFYVCMYIYIYTLNRYVYVYIYIYIHIYVYTCMYVCVCMYIYFLVYVCVYVEGICVYTYMHARISFPCMHQTYMHMYMDIDALNIHTQTNEKIHLNYIHTTHT